MARITANVNQALAPLAHDGRLETTWYSFGDPHSLPPALEIDLGTTRSIGTIRWFITSGSRAGPARVKLLGAADKRVLVAFDGAYASGSQPDWPELHPNRDARFVGLEFASAEVDQLAASVAEIEIWQ
jgi:hypothetical protein